MKTPKTTIPQERRGVILLVVLGALTFFSVLVATYLVFANDSKDASVALARQSARQPDVNWMMNEALMTLVRGTDDPNNPFFGEDMLSDYYGHDGRDMQVKRLPDPPVDASGNVQQSPPHPKFFGSGIVRFPISFDGQDGRQVPTAVPEITPPPFDDVYAGRLITFLEGPLENQTYRILRSKYRQVTDPTTGQVSPESYDDVYIDIDYRVFGGVAPSAASLFNQFYPDPTSTSTASYAFHLNGVARNARAIGYDGTEVGDTVSEVPGYQQSITLTNGSVVQVGFDTLPVALQPNHLGRNVDKSQLVATRGADFDEDYDAADFNNWFLSHRRDDGTVIPSFHRPSVLNYILNHDGITWPSGTQQNAQNLIASLARGTFRPFPIAQNQLAAGSPTIHERYTGGNAQYALRTALPIWSFSNTQVNAPALNQLLRALIEDNNGKVTYDVDNDADGVPDSIWIDLGLPVFTSREGKLLKPLVAPMIEDLSGRLNLNAHSNEQINSYSAARANASNNPAGLVNNAAFWAGTRAPFAAGNNVAFVFRGLGWGPAEIALPLTSDSGLITDATIIGNQGSWINLRYRFGQQQLQTPDYAGRTGRDSVDAILFGYRPRAHQIFSGFGRTCDPFGRGGNAVGRSGDMTNAASGTLVKTTTPFIDEAFNNPYESDPTGELSGDRSARLADLESVLRANDFDTELLPESLRNLLQPIINAHPEFSRVYTTTSSSDDSPLPLTAIADTTHLSLIELIRDIAFPGNPNTGNYSQAQWNQLIAPEIRLGRKLDVNRRIGNGVDDTVNGVTNGVIDEPLEVTRVDSDGNNNNVDAVTDEFGEVSAEVNAFQSIAGNVPQDFADVSPNNQSPNYTFDEPRPANNEIPVSGRQLLARHLYVLAMALSREFTNPGNVNSRYFFPLTHDLGGASPLTDSVDGSDPLVELYKSRRLAQWAVNVIDYFDPDSINTRFVFDPFPFDANGWDPLGVNGSGNPVPDTRTNPAETSNPERVVWGVESPQLLFSESAAFHDVRLRDTNVDNGEAEAKPADPANPAPGDDNDSDQVRIPQGSLFLELYCPHPAISVVDSTTTPPDLDDETHPSLPAEVFDRTTGLLDLDRAAPSTLGGQPDPMNGAPVWRVAITERHDSMSANGDISQRDLWLQFPDTASFDIDRVDELQSPGANNLSFERFIFFRDFAGLNTGQTVDVNPNDVFDAVRSFLGNAGLDADTTPGITSPTDVDAEEVFFAPSITTPFPAPPYGAANTDINNTVRHRQLEPGQYLTLAPRLRTHFGSKVWPAASAPGPGMIPGVPSLHRLDVDTEVGTNAAEGILEISHTGMTVTPNITGNTGTQSYTPATPLVIAAPRPSTWTNSTPPSTENNVIGLNVSEPLPRDPLYYPQPTQQYNGNGAVDQDGVLGEDYPLADAYVDFTDTAATAARDTPLDTDPAGLGDPAVIRIPSSGNNEPSLGTVPDYCSAYLQRLADPTIPYDPILNPYITMDWIQIDLTVFSGEEEESRIDSTGNIQYTRRTRQRNGHVLPLGGNPGDPPLPNANALHSLQTNDLQLESLEPGADDFFAFVGGAGNQHLYASLSFLNTETPQINPGFDGYALGIGQSAGGSPSVSGNDRNLPIQPFARHPWLNRPAASHLELMMVPACSQARLLAEFTFGFDPTNPPASPITPFYPASSGIDPNSAEAPFRHLLNFFHSNVETATGDDKGAEFIRLFDFVHTLPRFRGEVELINPQRLPATPVPPANAAQRVLYEFSSLFPPPFNFKYDNQRQAEINLNTIADFPVWAGLMEGHMNPQEYASAMGAAEQNQLAFQTFLNNRRGYATGTGGDINAGSAGQYNYAPTYLSPDYPTEFAGVYRTATMTPEASQLDTNANYPPGDPGLRRRPVNGTVLRGLGTLRGNETSPPSIVPFFVRDAASQQPHAPAGVFNANTVLSHERVRNPFMRYQTVMRMPNLVSENSQTFSIRMTLGFFEVDPNDTTNLGREYNAEIGQNERYQGTFVIDRSVPVGFKPGEDLNARDVVIFESYEQ